MTIETKIEALTTATEKNTAQLGELLAALQGNTAMLGTLNEGREAALEALTSKDAEPAKPTPRSRKKKDEEPEETKKEEPAPAKEETAAAWSPDLSVEGMRTMFSGYMTGTSDEAEKKTRVGNVQAILAELGVQAINPIEGKKHLESEDDKRKAAFYLARYNAGLPVNFQSDYDFNADPLTQDTAAGDDDLVG